MEHHRSDHDMREDQQDYSFSEQNVSQEMSEEGWRALAYVQMLRLVQAYANPSHRKIVRDVNPNLSPDEELGDLAAAEAAVNAKDAERAEIVDKLRDELRRKLFMIKTAQQN